MEKSNNLFRVFTHYSKINNILKNNNTNKLKKFMENYIFENNKYNMVKKIVLEYIIQNLALYNTNKDFYKLLDFIKLKFSNMPQNNYIKATKLFIEQKKYFKKNERKNSSENVKNEKKTVNNSSSETVTNKKEAVNNSSSETVTNVKNAEHKNENNSNSENENTNNKLNLENVKKAIKNGKRLFKKKNNYIEIEDISRKGILSIFKSKFKKFNKKYQNNRMFKGRMFRIRTNKNDIIELSYNELLKKLVSPTVINILQYYEFKFDDIKKLQLKYFNKVTESLNNTDFLKDIIKRILDKINDDHIIIFENNKFIFLKNNKLNNTLNNTIYKDDFGKTYSQTILELIKSYIERIVYYNKSSIEFIKKVTDKIEFITDNYINTSDYFYFKENIEYSIEDIKYWSCGIYIFI